MQKETENVLRSVGDLLLQLGCHNSWLVPNMTLGSRSLNTAISEYQARLDFLEQQTSYALAAARAKETSVVKENSTVAGGDENVDLASADDNQSMVGQNELNLENSTEPVSGIPNAFDDFGLGDDVMGNGGLDFINPGDDQYGLDNKLDNGYDLLDDQY